MEHLHHRILIVGGGAAGLAVAARLIRAGQTDVAIIEPSHQHYYQPLWTLVGAGVVAKEASMRDERRCIPAGAHWIKDAVSELDPEHNRVLTTSAKSVGYDFLVVAAGIRFMWEAIPGLREAIDSPHASTNYLYDRAPRTWELIKNFKGGVALFHMPGGSIKCPGAPQKIMYLAADYFRKSGVGRANVIYGSAMPSIYGIPEYAAVLNRVVERYGIDARYGHELVAVHPRRREAVFALKNEPGRRVTIQYDMLHAVPPQGAPEFVRDSALADPQRPLEGFIKVDQFTLRNPGYQNVFALGDVANTPNAKTGASACKQAPAVAANLLSVIGGKEPRASYDGYVACPIVTAYGRMLLCEFDYGGKPTPTIPFINTIKERRDMWLLKRYGLPWLYWNMMLTGRSVPFLHSGGEQAATRRLAADSQV